VTTVGEVSERFARIFSDRNISAIGESLGNINEASAQLPSTLHDIRALTADLRGASAEISAAARSVHDLSDRAGPELLAALQRVHVVADNLASTSAKLDALVQDNRQDVRVFARDGLPQLEQLLRDGRGAALELRELSRSLRENPSRLLYQTNSQALEIPP
jgi:ABC-type transporter Mla subunit MlaD